jgi:hypothetical protein
LSGFTGLFVAVNTITVARVIATLSVPWAVRRKLWAAAFDGTHPNRFLLMSMLLLAPVRSFVLIGDSPQEGACERHSLELAGNGYHAFVRAFRNNDLEMSYVLHHHAGTRGSKRARNMRKRARPASSRVVRTTTPGPSDHDVVARADCQDRSWC